MGSNIMFLTPTTMILLLSSLALTPGILAKSDYRSNFTNHITFPDKHLRGEEVYLCTSKAVEDGWMTGFKPSLEAEGYFVHHMSLVKCGGRRRQGLWNCGPQGMREQGIKSYSFCSGRWETVFVFSGDAASVELPHQSGIHVKTREHLVLQAHLVAHRGEPGGQINNVGVEVYMQNRRMGREGSTGGVEREGGGMESEGGGIEREGGGIESEGGGIESEGGGVEREGGLLPMYLTGSVPANGENTWVGTVTVGEGTRVEGVLVHTHQLAKQVSLWAVTDSRRLLVHNQTREMPQKFYFNLPEIAPGTKLEARCHMSSNRITETYYGPKSTDEMCNVYWYYVKD